MLEGIGVAQRGPCKFHTWHAQLCSLRSPIFCSSKIAAAFQFQCIKNTRPRDQAKRKHESQQAPPLSQKVCLTVSNIRHLLLLGPIHHRNRPRVFHMWHQLVRWLGIAVSCCKRFLRVPEPKACTTKCCRHTETQRCDDELVEACAFCWPSMI